MVRFKKIMLGFGLLTAIAWAGDGPPSAPALPKGITLGSYHPVASKAEQFNWYGKLTNRRIAKFHVELGEHPIARYEFKLLAGTVSLADPSPANRPGQLPSDANSMDALGRPFQIIAPTPRFNQPHARH